MASSSLTSDSGGLFARLAICSERQQFREALQDISRKLSAQAVTI